VIHMTARHRRVAIFARRELGEWGPENRAGQVLPTPDPLALTGTSGKEPWPMLPWIDSLLRANPAVQFATERVCEL